MPSALLLALVPLDVRVFRVNTSAINVSWAFNVSQAAWALSQFGQADGARVNVDVSFATTSSFVAGTRLGAMSTNNTFLLVTPSTFDDPATFVDPSHSSIYVRVSPSYQQDQEGVFAESDPWVTTSECADTVHYLNDTDAVGDLEPAVGKWACLDCPFNAVCEGGQFNTWHRVRAKFGSWRANQANRGASEFLPCLAPQMCLGAPNPNLMGLHFDQSNPDIDLALVENVTEGCAKFGTGPLCSVCQGRSWRSSAYECNECAPPFVSVLLTSFGSIVIILVLIGTIWVTIFDEETETAIDLQMVKIMVNHLVISSSTGKLPLRWGPFLNAVFSFFDALSFQFGEGSMSLDCVAHDADNKSSIWLTTSIAAALTPIVLVALSALTLLPTKSYWRKKFYIDSVVVFKVSVMVILLLAHPTLTRLSTGLFACRDIHPTVTALGVRIKQADQHKYTSFSVLERDFGQVCEDGLMLTVRFALGAPMILLYVIGVPSYYFWRLCRSRNNLDRVRYKYSFLLSGFREQRYYWEVYNTVRKALFTIVTVLLLPVGPRMQIWGTMLVLQVFYGMETWGHPHVNPILNGIEDLALSLDVLQLFCGLGLFFSTDDGLTGTATFLSITILVSNIAFIVYWIYMWWKYSDYRKKAAKSIKGLSMRAAMNLSSKLVRRTTSRRGKANSFFGVDDNALKEVLELKRKRNQQLKAKRRKLREERKKGGRRRKTLREDVLDKDAASAASIRVRKRMDAESATSKLRRASRGAKMMGMTAFLRHARPERVPSAVMNLQTSEEIHVVKKAEGGTNTTEKNSRRRKSRGSCFIPRPEHESAEEFRDSDSDDDEERIDPVQKEIDEAEEKLLELLRKGLETQKVDALKEESTDLLAAEKKANLVDMGETMRGGVDGGRGGASMWGKLRSAVSIARPSSRNKSQVQRLEFNFNRMSSNASSPYDAKQQAAASSFAKGKPRLGRGASSRAKRRLSSREVIRAAEEAKELKVNEVTLDDGVELTQVGAKSPPPTTAPKRPTLQDLASAVNHSKI